MTWQSLAAAHAHADRANARRNTMAARCTPTATVLVGVRLLWPEHQLLRTTRRDLLKR